MRFVVNTLAVKRLHEDSLAEHALVINSFAMNGLDGNTLVVRALVVIPLM